MSAEILAFPDQSAMTEQERVDILVDAHAAIVEALTQHQTADMMVPAMLTIDEAMQMCQVIEDLLGPDFFDDAIEPD